MPDEKIRVLYVARSEWGCPGKRYAAGRNFRKLRGSVWSIPRGSVCAIFSKIQTIVFQEPAEIQAALKSYLESGKTTIDNNEFTSECGLMLMGNIPLNEKKRPLNYRYFDSLPENFRESALLDRFHCFIEGWHLPRIHKGMIFTGWTINVEYFSEILHALRTQNVYGLIFDQLVKYDKNADTRDFNAVKRIAVGYMKLLFPHWTNTNKVNLEEFDTYCLQPAIRRRGIIKEQCHFTIVR